MWKHYNISVYLVVLSFCAVSAGSPDNVKITLHVFSGTPDPFWTIRSNNERYQELVTRVTDLQSSPLASRLGYSGYTVSTGEGVVNSKTVGMCKDTCMESFLLDTIEHLVPDGADSPLNDSVISYVRDQLAACP